MTKTNKVILISALEGLAAIALAALLVFSLWILCSPQTMATACERTGNYSFAVKCAALRYSYTKNADDLARCVHDSILSGNDGYVLKYGEKFIDDDKFEETCKSRGEEQGISFADYVIGNVAEAKYRADGIDEAVKICLKGTVNGFIWLTLAVNENANEADKSALIDALEELPETETVTNLLNILKNTGD